MFPQQCLLVRPGPQSCNISVTLPRYISSNYMQEINSAWRAIDNDWSSEIEMANNPCPVRETQTSLGPFVTYEEHI